MAGWLRPFGFLRVGGSLQTRIAASAMATSLCVLVMASFLFFTQQWASDASEVRHQQGDLAAVMATQAGSALADPLKAQRLLDGLSRGDSVRQAYLLDPQHLRLATYRAAGPGHGHRRLLETRIAVAAPGGGPPGELVLMAEPDHAQRTLLRYFAVCAALFFAATGAALFLGRWLAQRLMEPIDRLSNFLSAVTQAGDLSARAPSDAPAEIAQLTVSVDALLDRLQANDAALRRTLGELVEARDAAQAANVMKSHFLANVSHEIRTPLNGVLAMAQIMEMGELAADQRERLQVVRDSGEALLAVLNDVLDISKIEAGELAMEARPFDPAAAVRVAAAASIAQAEAKGLRFLIEAREDLAHRIGDEGRLRQLVVNLVSNAVKFTAFGEVRVRLRDLREEGRDVLAIDVSDTGPGIAAEVMPKLFQKFMQGDGSTTRRFGGTGLGLAICRELAGLMGGRLWAESRLAEGSTFHLRVPLPRAAAARPAEAPIAPPRRAAAAPISVPAPVAAGGARRLRVLAAEDNAVNRQVLGSVLAVFGVDVEFVEDGAAAVEAWRRSGPDVILMDIQMPVMDGVAATRAIREEEQRLGRPRTPIVALSANAMSHQVHEYLAAGMDRHVPKPIEIPRLRAALDGAVALRRAA